jgi:hypothetical protein
MERKRPQRRPRDALILRACQRPRQLREWLWLASEFDLNGDDVVRFVRRCQRLKLYLVD